METKKLLPLSGIAFVGLILLSVVGVGGGTPESGASATELAEFYEDNALRQGLSSFLLAAAVPFVVFFGIGLMTSATHWTEPGISAWGYVLLVGTTFVGGGVLVAAFVHFALANGGDEKISPTALEALNSLDGNSWMVFNPALGVMMLGAAGLLLSAGVMRWLGWIALLLGVAGFIPFADFFAMLGTLVWIVVVGVALSRAKTEPAYVAAPGAA